MNALFVIAKTSACDYGNRQHNYLIDAWLKNLMLATELLAGYNLFNNQPLHGLFEIKQRKWAVYFILLLCFNREHEMLIKTEGDRKKLISKVLDLKLDKGPYLVTAEKFKPDRSGAQNRLSYMWYAFIGKQTGEGKDYIRNYCKFTYGCEIVSADDSEFSRFYDNLINKYDYEDCVSAMQYIQVTSLMNVKQMADYLNHIDLYAVERGCQLPQPQDLMDEALGLTKERPVEQANT